MNPEETSALRRLVDRLAEMAPADDVRMQNALSALRQEVDAQEDAQDRAAEELRQFQAAYEKLTAPANRVGVYLKEQGEGKALIVQGETEFVVEVDPAVAVETLKRGVRVRLNEAYAVVGVLGPSDSGALVSVLEVLEDGRLRVGQDGPAQMGRLVWRGPELEGAEMRKGDEVRLDGSGRFAIEHLAKREAREYFLEDVPQTPWEKIGGQDEAVGLIRETLEYPMLHPEIYAAFDKKPVKGILLYGPPGCGKTLIGKAVAYNLAKDYSERTGKPVKEAFLSISGPKILNMWLGESERMVRDVFAQAREKAKEGNLVVLFIDEAESLLRTRSGGRFLNISNTLVPQFCAEMDGMSGLENVVVILTSNRPDYIDPAILRPERIDRKIKVNRPNQVGSREILEIYLHAGLPIDPALLAEFDGEASCARKELVETAIQTLWRREGETEFLKVAKRNGSVDPLYWSDFVSGALLKSIVDRAKDIAIRRAVAAPEAGFGLRREDLKEALAAEFAEGEIFPKNEAVEDWLKLLDVEPDDVVGVESVRQENGSRRFRKEVM